MNQQKKSKTVFIVEGHKDAEQVEGALPTANCLVTGGTRINNTIKGYADFYSEKGYELYVLSDPDEAGTQLYEMVQYSIGDIPRIMPDPEQCKYFTGKKFRYGIEHASYNYLRELLGGYMVE